MIDPESKQEMAEMPLEARLSFIDRAQSNTEWINAKAIAEEIGIYDRWVYRTVNDFGIQSEVRISDGVEIAMYPPWTVDILREELHWREHLRELPEELNVGEIAENIGRSYGWTRKTLEKIDAKPVRKKVPVRYGKRYLKELRYISMAVPLDDGWYNLRQLVELTGQDREWIERRISEAGCMSMDRRSALTGRVHEYFPPEALSIITNAMAERATAAGEWMTVSGMAKRIGRNEKWVSSRVGRYEESSAMRQDDMGVTRTHYPPSVFFELEAESERNKQLPVRGDHLNIHEVARLAGHGTEWAKHRLPKIGIEPELRKDRKGRAQLCYPPSTVQLLIDYEKENHHGSEMITSETIWERQVSVGSLRSQIRLQQTLDKELRNNGVLDTDNERASIKSNIEALRRELKLATQRVYMLEAKVYQQLEDEE